jgi:hypothetical protein
MKTILIVLALASFLMAQDSVLIAPVMVKQGILTTKITAYNANALLNGISINTGNKTVSAQTPFEILPYISPDTTQKNIPPYVPSNLTWKYTDFGADSVVFIKALAR